jgi:hypothetical protein
VSSVNHGFVLFAVDLFKLAELIVDYVGFIFFDFFSYGFGECYEYVADVGKYGAYYVVVWYGKSEGA